MATLRALPLYVAVDATGLVVFQGPPNVAIEWNLVGDGSLSNASTHTGPNGLAYAKFTPLSEGEVEISVNHGT